LQAVLNLDELFILNLASGLMIFLFRIAGLVVWSQE
jgi:hypothetical protein